MGKHYTLGVYNYEREKLCDLYDSKVELMGQAFDISVTEEFEGYHTIEFTIPYVIRMSDGSYDKNFRWDFLKSEYLIKYTADDKTIWYVATKPVKKKSGKNIIGTVTCSGYESLLKTRNIYMAFDDENGIGTMDYLMEKILLGTYWSYDDAHSDTLYENDGTTVKVRSFSSKDKKGALGMITSVCNLFQARPIFDTDNQKVIIKSNKNRQQVVEGEVGRNLTSLSVKHDSSNVCTRLYVEGEYGDYGYVGIDDVIVNGTKWGVPFVFNFDYYKELGLFTDDHQTALDTYMTDIRNIKSQLNTAGIALIEQEDYLNTMIGQCKMVLYYVSDMSAPAYIYGNVSSDAAQLHTGDEVVILYSNHTHEYIKWPEQPVRVLIGAYGVAKFVTKSAGKIGAAEVQIEAKQKAIEEINRKRNNLVPTDPKMEEYDREIELLEEQIYAIYIGTHNENGLYDMMYNIMNSSGALYVLEGLKNDVAELNEEQDEIEATFVSAMGYLLRDGYWSNKNYITGQESFLYADAIDMAKEMSHPDISYSFDYKRIVEDFGISTDDIEINAIFKVLDTEMRINDNLYIKKITYGVDKKNSGTIDVSNKDLTLSGNDVGTLLSRMSQLADLIEQKNALYERARAISESGSIYADRLNGQIDVVKTQILSSVSNWHTDDNGNILFETVDGSSAMMLSGAGFMLANTKDDNGDWEWRTLGDGSGITADEIVAGFLSADRIEAGSIQASHLASDVGESLNLESNVALNAYIVSEAQNAADAIAEMKLNEEQFSIWLTDSGLRADLEGQISDVQDDLNGYKAEVSNYMRYDNTGTLTLGKSDSNFTTEMTNEKLSFKDSGTEVAYISNQNMYITKANVTDEFSLGTDNNNGYYDWIVTSTGLGLKYRSS